MKRYNLYTDFDTLPIFNYYKLLLTNDLRYLIICDSLPEINKTEWIQKHYNKLIYSNLDNNKKQFDFNISLQKNYFNLIETFRKWFDNKEDKTLEQKIHNQLVRYIDFLDSNFKNFQILDKVYLTLKEFYIELKEQLTYEDLLNNCIFIFNYQILKYENKNKFDLYEELPTISKYYGFQIDIKKTSVTEYFSLREKMIENLNKENKK